MNRLQGRLKPDPTIDRVVEKYRRRRERRVERKDSEAKEWSAFALERRRQVLRRDRLRW